MAINTLSVSIIIVMNMMKIEAVNSYSVYSVLLWILHKLQYHQEVKDIGVYLAEQVEVHAFA